MAPQQDRAEPPLADYLAARQRPVGWPAGYQEWRQLLFLHWPVRPDALRPLVPAPLNLDLFEGVTYVSLVPFVVQAARPLGAPRNLSLRFLETNVRTYVHLGGREPGVYFFSLDAASAIAVLGARVSLGLPYFLARGRLRGSLAPWERLNPGVRAAYRLRRLGRAGGHCEVDYGVGDPVGPAEPGSLDFFLIERYVLHARRGPSLWSVQVHHQPYPLQGVQVGQLTQSLTDADGLPPLDARPLAHFSPGVDVAIFPPRVRLLR
jgi:uncharacterized protein YqjF (DUF2071 family)